MKRGLKILSVLVVLVVGAAVAGIVILKSMDFNEYKDLIAEQAKSATGRDLAIKGDLNLEISMNPAIAVEGVRFSNAEWGSRPEMVTVKRFAAEIALMPLIYGTVDVKRVVLEGVDLLAETDKSGKGNWVFGAPKEKPEKQTGGAGQLPVVRMVRVKDIKVTYKDGQTSETIALALDRIDLNADGADAPLKIAVDGNINGEAFNVGGQLGSVKQLAAGGTFPLKLDVTALKAKVSVDGKAGLEGGAPAADLNLNIGGDDINNTVAAAQAIVPALKDVQLPPLGAYSVATRAGFDGKQLRLSDLAVKIGSTDLGGKATVDLAAKPLTVTASLTSNLINADEFLPKTEASEPAPEPEAKEEEKDEEAKKNERVFPDDPLPLDGLKAANADIDFSGAKLVAKGIEVTDIKVGLKLKGGRLAVRPMDATVFAGKITGDVSLDGAAAAPGLKAKLDVAGLDYGIAGAAFMEKAPATGKVDVNVDVTGKGNSVRKLMAGLSGKTRIVTEDGRIDSDALNIVSTDIVNMFDSKDDKTLRCGVVHFDIKDGMADARAIVVETGGFSVIGTGKIDLKDEKPTLRVDPRAKKTNLASAAMVPVDISGTLANPEWALDAGAAAGNVAAGTARTVGAIATGGLSLLGELALKKAGEAAGAVDENDYCLPALAGKKVVPGEMKKAEAKTDSGGEASSGESTEEKATGAVEDAKKEGEGAFDKLGDGLGSGLKSLFGD